MDVLLFTHKAGSLVHPCAMIMLCLLWVAAMVLGLQARNHRLHASRGLRGESRGLLNPIPKAIDSKYHHKLAAALTFLTTLSMFTGMYNTYLRSGRLYPGPHMYGGFVFLLLITANASLVPWFKDFVRIRVVHRSIGFCVIGMAIWQAWTGLPVMKSVYQTIPW